jgi:hypothetical protein
MKGDVFNTYPLQKKLYLAHIRKNHKISISYNYA